MITPLNHYPANWPQVAKQVKDEAGWRCIRCGHPHESPLARILCDEQCDPSRHRGGLNDGKQRVLTVHHLDSDKRNLAFRGVNKDKVTCRALWISSSQSRPILPRNLKQLGATCDLLTSECLLTPNCPGLVESDGFVPGLSSGYSGRGCVVPALDI